MLVMVRSRQRSCWPLSYRRELSIGHLLIGALDVGRGFLVGFQVLDAAGQQVAALRRFGVQQAAQHERNGGARHPARGQARERGGGILVGDLGDAEHRGGHQRGQRQQQLEPPGHHEQRAQRRWRGSHGVRQIHQRRAPGMVAPPSARRPQ
jgi:hypothetical protein